MQNESNNSSHRQRKNSKSSHWLVSVTQTYWAVKRFRSKYSNMIPRNLCTGSCKFVKPRLPVGSGNHPSKILSKNQGDQYCVNSPKSRVYIVISLCACRCSSSSKLHVLSAWIGRAGIKMIFRSRQPAIRSRRRGAPNVVSVSKRFWLAAFALFVCVFVCVFVSEWNNK